MLNSLAKLAVQLDVDTVANGVLERLYANGRSSASRFSRRFQILIYHKVSTDLHPFFEPVTPDVFEQHVRFLKQCYRVMDLAELVQRSQQGDVPPSAVAITFDDGYRDNYEHAFPILRAYGLPATIFLATGAVGTGQTLWHDRVFDAFRYTSLPEADLSSENLPPLSLRNHHERVQALQKALARGKELFGDARLRFVEAIEAALTPGRRNGPEKRMLSWDEVREMHSAGISFGSHTVTHPIVSRIPREELLRELRESSRQISEQLNTPVKGFAYPNGRSADYSDAVKDALRECGYAYAVTTEMGPNRPYCDPFSLRRGQPWQTDIRLFRFNFFLQRHELTNVRN